MATTSGSLIFLTGMLPIKHHAAVFRGRLGAEIDLEQGQQAARLAALNALAVMRRDLGSLDRVVRVLRLGVFIAATSGFSDHPKVADGASRLIEDLFGADSNPCRLVIGVNNLPLNTPIELEFIAELAGAH
jgi:enamine deaminase RidA (YjgF/YER057c/UK114 family)